MAEGGRPVTALNDFDAIVLGSPNHYASLTADMRSFLEAMELKAVRKS